MHASYRQIGAMLLLPDVRPQHLKKKFYSSSRAVCRNTTKTEITVRKRLLKYHTQEGTLDSNRVNYSQLHKLHGECYCHFASAGVLIFELKSCDGWAFFADCDRPLNHAEKKQTSWTQTAQFRSHVVFLIEEVSTATTRGASGTETLTVLLIAYTCNLIQMDHKPVKINNCKKRETPHEDILISCLWAVVRPQMLKIKGFTCQPRKKHCDNHILICK